MITIAEQLKEIEHLLRNKSTDKWLNLMQACDYTSLSVSTLRRAVDRGRLKVSKEAGKLMFRRSWLDRWLGGK